MLNKKQYLNILEELDILVRRSDLINESEKFKDIPIDPSMETEEQGKEYIRDFFANELMKGDMPEPPEGPEPPEPPEPPIMPIGPTPPPPPFKKKLPKLDGGAGKDDPKIWSEAEVEWDEDDFLKRLEIEADELEKEPDPDEMGEDYDDFMDKKGGTGGGDGDEGEDDDDDKKSDDDGDGSGEGKSGKRDPFRKDKDDDEYEERHGGGDGEDDEEGEDGDGESKEGESGGKGKEGKEDEGEDGEEGGDGKGEGKSKDRKKGKKGSSKSGKGEGTDDMDEEGEDGEGAGEDGKGSGKSGKKEGDEDKEGKGSGKGDGDDGDEKGGDDSGKSGESGGKSVDEELEETIKEAIEKLAEANEDEKEELSELLDMLKGETSDEDIDSKEKEFDETKEGGKEKLDKLKSLVGRLEKPVSKEEIEKEIEASKLSEDEIKDLKDSTVKTATMPAPPKDEKLDELKKEAMKELDRKCKGKSKLATSILYHSLRTPKLDSSDWDKIIEKVLKKKSKHFSTSPTASKTKKVILGDKNHIWRDVRYGHKTVKKGDDKQAIYCFIDYSGSVKGQPGLIISFLGKVLEMTEKLKYTDLQLYTFADYLSVPRIISQKMLADEGYEKVLTDTINFFDLPENDVGGSIEDFSLVGYEINKIKRDDKDAVIFIFGDGVWTFYGNSNPPTRLKEICARYIKDIIAFVFYLSDDSFKWNNVGKEISLLKDVVGIEDVIVTKASKMKE